MAAVAPAIIAARSVRIPLGSCCSLRGAYFTYMRRLRHASLLGVSMMAPVLFLSGVAQACPNCRTARAVRATVFDDNFWTHLTFITLPLLVLAVVAFLLYRIGLERPRPARTRNAADVNASRATART
jgi:hypothetical protein